MPRVDDEQNLALAESISVADQINAAFYNRFPYPWPPQTFDFVDDKGLEAKLLNQSIGAWKHDRISATGSVWVAGCGTNQAINAALRFPSASIVGSDISPASLEICARTAEQLQLTNLELRRESLNDVDYVEQFDLVVSTGVIHHNADPTACLRRLARAMKPSAVLELMVYNRFQRFVCSALQKAVRLIASGDSQCHNAERELVIATKLVSAFQVDNQVRRLLHEFRHTSEAAMADAFVQPIEHSYTVESVAQLAHACALEIVAPVVNEWDVAAKRYLWHVDFDGELASAYETLPDLIRWQVTNLLLLDRSPMLWFYLQRMDAPYGRPSQRDLNDSFLDTAFERVRSTRRYYRLTMDGTYVLSSGVAPFPTANSPQGTAPIYDAVDGVKTIRSILALKNLPSTFADVLRYRLQLTTPAFPFLIAANRA